MSNTAAQPGAINPDVESQLPRFAVWRLLNTFITSREEVPIAKGYDGPESWELNLLSAAGREKRISEKKHPFISEEQTIVWLKQAIVPATPEYVTGSKKKLCSLYGIKTKDFKRHFTATAKRNVYHSGLRPGRTAILRNEYTPFWGPIVYLKEATGRPPKDSLREFWKLEDIGTTPDFDTDDLIDQDFSDVATGISDDPCLSLGNDWEFEQIEKIANGKRGHRFQGLDFRSYQHRLAEAAYDLDEALYKVHPNAPASAKVDFYKSYETHRHLCLFARTLASYAEGPLTRGLDWSRRDELLCSFGDACDAFRCVQTQISNFARALFKDGAGSTPAHAKVAKESRAMTVAKVINELNDLKPQMFEDNGEYERLRAQYPGFLTFQIAEKRPDLKLKILAIRGSTKHIRLAQELAAAHHGKMLSTIQDDWKDCKPEEFKLRARPSASPTQSERTRPH